MVSSSVAVTFMFGGVATGNMNGIVLCFTALAFIFDLGEEIAAGAMDVKGDTQRAVRSVASVHGRRFALNVSGILFALFIGLSFVPYLLGWIGTTYLVLVTATDVALAFFALRLVSSGASANGRVRLRQLYLTLAVFVAAFIVSRVLSL